MADKAKKNAGKAPSVQFYYKDFLADMSEHGPDIVGAWLLILIKIWHTKAGGSITKTLPQLARIMHTDQPNAQRLLDYISSENIADVTNDNGKITIVNRRTERDAKLLAQNRLRQQRYRAGQDGNADVTPRESNPSTSNEGEDEVEDEKEVEVFPVNLRTPEFQEAWCEWEQYRREIRKKLTPFSVKKQLKNLSNYTVAVAIECIEISIRNSWQGLFPEKVQNGKRGTTQRDFTGQTSQYGQTV